MTSRKSFPQAAATLTALTLPVLSLCALVGAPAHGQTDISNTVTVTADPNPRKVIEGQGRSVTFTIKNAGPYDLHINATGFIGASYFSGDIMDAVTGTMSPNFQNVVDTFLAQGQSKSFDVDFTTSPADPQVFRLTIPAIGKSREALLSTVPSLSTVKSSLERRQAPPTYG